jgi:acetoin:2,6-dichlorophenolindophenol oxidoreductase subunit beta
MREAISASVNEAISQALAEEMRHDPNVLLFGEGVATKRAELVNEFGRQRVRNTPLAEGIIAGTAAGAAAAGLRPVVDLLFAPFLCYAMDEIVNSAGKLRFISGGQFQFPMVVLAMTGAGWSVGAQHNHNVEAWFAHAPGLKVVMPSRPSDFKGLLKSAIRDDNPVLFFVDLALGQDVGLVCDESVLTHIGSAHVVRAGRDLTMVTYGKAVGVCAKVADALAEEGVSCELIDLRTIKPLDEEAIVSSVKRTGRLIVVHEASRTCGVGAEVAALAAEHAFAQLKAPVLRITGPDAPVSASWLLESLFVPQFDAVCDAARQLMKNASN